MGGGGLIQLVAVGAQDVYITGQPQITFFKSVYRRHTNFAIEPVLQNINGNPKFGEKISVTIFKNGDLLKNLWVQYSPKDVLAAVTPSNPNYFVGANVGHAILDSVELEIGGQIIDKQYGKWMTIWNYLTDCDATYQGAIGNQWEEPGYQDNAIFFDDDGPTRYNIMAYTHRADFGLDVVTPPVPTIEYAPDQAYVPLRFWFCRNPGLAIPLLALQYTEVKLNITIGTAAGIYCLATNPSPPPAVIPLPPTPTGNEFNSLRVYADYIYLDSSERRQFAQNAHEYLIEQLQVMHNTTDTTINLIFKHPVKELVWSPIPLPVSFDNTGGVPSAFVPGLASPNASLVQSDYSLLFNGTPRFPTRDFKYFTRCQVWEYHTGYGSILFPNSVAVYSFALRPEEHQPSGTCNFSRLDSAKIVRTSTDAIDVYATNYNILRIMSGKGALAYIN